MAIRLRKTPDGDYVALCAAEHIKLPGDTYLHDGFHHALYVKFAADRVLEDGGGAAQVTPREDDLRRSIPLERWRAALISDALYERVRFLEGIAAGLALSPREGAEKCGALNWTGTTACTLPKDHDGLHCGGPAWEQNYVSPDGPPAKQVEGAAQQEEEYPFKDETWRSDVTKPADPEAQSKAAQQNDD